MSVAPEAVQLPLYRAAERDCMRPLELHLHGSLNDIRMFLAAGVELQ